MKAPSRACGIATATRFITGTRIGAPVTRPRAKRCARPRTPTPSRVLRRLPRQARTRNRKRVLRLSRPKASATGTRTLTAGSTATRAGISHERPAPALPLRVQLGRVLRRLRPRGMPGAGGGRRVDWGHSIVMWRPMSERPPAATPRLPSAHHPLRREHRGHGRQVSGGHSDRRRRDAGPAEQRRVPAAPAAAAAWDGGRPARPGHPRRARRPRPARAAGAALLDGAQAAAAASNSSAPLLNSVQESPHNPLELLV